MTTNLHENRHHHCWVRIAQAAVSALTRRRDSGHRRRGHPNIIKKRALTWGKLECEAFAVRGEKLELVTAPAELDRRGNQDGFALHVVMSRMACQTSETCLVVRSAKVRL